MFVILIVVIILILILYHNYQNYVQCDLPGPKPKPLIGNALEFLSESPLTVLSRWTKQYGQLYKVTLASDLYVIMTDPVDVETIISNIKYNSKALSYKFLSLWLKDGLITSDGEVWQRHRKFLTSTFHFKILENSIDVMTKNANIFVEQLENQIDKSDFNIQMFVEKCSLDIICESAMGLQVNIQTSEFSSYLHAVKALTEITVNRIFKLWLQPNIFYKMSGYDRKFKESLFKVEKHSREVIISRRQQILENKNGRDSDLSHPEKKVKIPFLDLMLRESNFTDEEIHSEVMSFMFAGHDTTTAGISFCIYLLSQYPEVQNKVFEELSQKLPRDSLPSIQDLGNLKYMECVIKESIRLFPPVPMIGRFLPNAVKLPCGTILPPNTQVNIFIYEMHRDPKIFQDPEKFSPERFMGDKVYPPFAYIPFSAGPRNCIGQRFAMLEMKTVLSTLLKRYQLLPASNSHLILTYELILRSKNGILIRLKRRK